MWLPFLVVFLAAINGYLWLLKTRLDALPANAAHAEAYLKDEPLQVSEFIIKE